MLQRHELNSLPQAVNVRAVQISEGEVKHLLALHMSAGCSSSWWLAVGVSGRQPGEERDIRRHSDRVNTGNRLLSGGGSICKENVLEKHSTEKRLHTLLRKRQRERREDETL